MDGTRAGTCSSCTHVFDLPPDMAGRYTLKDLVTMEGGVRGSHYSYYKHMFNIISTAGRAKRYQGRIMGSNSK